MLRAHAGLRVIAPSCAAAPCCRTRARMTRPYLCSACSICDANVRLAMMPRGIARSRLGISQLVSTVENVASSDWPPAKALAIVAPMSSIEPAVWRDTESGRRDASAATTSCRHWLRKKGRHVDTRHAGARSRPDMTSYLTRGELLQHYLQQTRSAARMRNGIHA